MKHTHTYTAHQNQQSISSKNTTTISTPPRSATTGDSGPLTKRRRIGWFLFFQMRTRIAARRKLEPAEAGAVVVKCVTAARTSTSGSSWRSCFRARASTVPVYAGWTVARVCSRSRTRSAWPGCGANERIGRQWTTTSWAVASGNITRKGSWRRRSVARGWSISSAILTACKLPGSR